jgi:AraC-like DNA-binding protein
MRTEVIFMAVSYGGRDGLGCRKRTCANTTKFRRRPTWLNPERVANGNSAEKRARILGDAVGTVEDRTPVQRAIGLLEMHRGLVSLDVVAREAGLSTRQFRRICARETGLTPKLLARILRFRHAALRAASETGAHAGLAAECGYADQAHMIAEFKRFGGRTPCGL